MVFGIVVECEIRARGRHIALLLNLVDAHGGYIKDPQIVVIFRVFVAPEEVNLIPDGQSSVTPARTGPFLLRVSLY